MLLKDLHEFIEENAGLMTLRAFRRSYMNLLTLTASLEDVRYLDRSFCGPTFYIARSDNILEEVVHPMNFREHKRAFRMEAAEFGRLVRLIDRDPVFHGRQNPGRSQRHPGLQLAVFLYQLGHGAPVSEAGWRFGRLPGRLTSLPLLLTSIDGTVKNYSLRAATAIERLFDSVVTWPTPEERDDMKIRMRQDSNIPDLLGFIDGTHIILHKEPSLEKDQAATFFCRKRRYAVLVLAVCDDRKRFTYLQTGHFGSASDARAQAHCALFNEPACHFRPGEFVLGDSGFASREHLVSMYRVYAGNPLLRFQRFFNAQVAPARVAIEHAFGVLKMRWRALKDLNMRVGSQSDLNYLLAWVRCAVVLHNLFIDTSSLYWDDKDYREARQIQAEIDSEIEKNERHELNRGPPAPDTRRDRLAYEIHVLTHPTKVKARRKMFRDVFMQ